MRTDESKNRGRNSECVDQSVVKLMIKVNCSFILYIRYSVFAKHEIDAEDVSLSLWR